MHARVVTLQAFFLSASLLVGCVMEAAGEELAFRIITFNLVEDHRYDCRVDLRWAWPTSNPSDMTYLGISGMSLIDLDPHVRNQPYMFRPILLPFRVDSGGTYVLGSDQTSAFIEDKSTRRLVFLALDLSKPGAVARLTALKEVPHDLFLLATNQRELNAGVTHLREETNARGKRGLGASWFTPALREVPKNLDCLVFDKCNLHKIDGRLLGSVRRVEIVYCTNVDLRGIQTGEAIRELVLVETEIGDLRPLSKIRTLRSLAIVGSAFSAEEYKGYWENIVSMRGLASLQMSFYGRSVFSLEGIEQLASLQSLFISYDLSTEDLQRLAKLPKLRVLELHHARGLESLPVLQGLEVLAIREAYTVKAIPALSQMPRLMYVDLSETGARWSSNSSRPASLKHCLPSEEE